MWPPDFLAPLYAEANPGGWTVFDLRPLRSKFASFDHADRDLERLIFGYDMLVLVPAVTAQIVIKQLLNDQPLGCSTKEVNVRQPEGTRPSSLKAHYRHSWPLMLPVRT
jgi:hypothetical protein